MEKKVRFARFMKPEKVKEIRRLEGAIFTTPLLDVIGGKIFKILDEGRYTVTISIDDECQEIDKTLISEILEYDRSEVLSALEVLKQVCKCHTTRSGDCDDTCPFYEEACDRNCKLLELPSDWVIVNEEIWRPIR